MCSEFTKVFLKYLIMFQLLRNYTCLYECGLSKKTTFIDKCLVSVQREICIIIRPQF